MPDITGFDHFVLTARDTEATVRFYRDALGMAHESFDAADGTRRQALLFGEQKINLHDASAPFSPHAKCPEPGSQDFCLLTETDLYDWIAHLSYHGIPLEDGPVARTGAAGPMTSIYVRDPDGNLVEIAQYDGGATPL